jgi:hypothetical protein
MEKPAQQLMDLSASHFSDKNGKLVEDHKGETDTKQATCTFLKEEAYIIAPPKGEQAGKEAAHVR